MSDMTRNEAREALKAMTPMNVAEQLADGHRALETVAAAPKDVAELVRIHRALEELVRKVGTEDHYPPADDWERGVDAACRDVTDTLTRILEGDRDE